MSHTRDLATLARTLDTGSDGQVLTSLGGSSFSFADAAAGSSVTSYAAPTNFPSSGNTVGDFAFATNAPKALYVWDGSEWDRIYSDSQEGPTFTTSPNSTYALTGGANTDVTVAASDPDGFPITYSVVTNPTNQAQATITQPSSGTFRFAASNTTSNAGSFTAKFVANDGVQIQTVSSAISLGFVGPLLGFANNVSGVTYTSRTSIQGSPAAAFDNSTDQGHNCWHGGAFNSSLKDWLMVDFGSGNAKVITEYGIAERYSGEARVTSWKLQGSNDASTFTDLQSLIVEGVDVSRKIMGYNGHSLNTQSNYLSYFHTFNLTSTTSYRYIRLWVEAAGGGYPVIGEMYMEGY